MATLPTVNENSAARLTVTFLDFDSEQSAPSSVTYRVDTAAGVQLRDDTSLTPAGQIQITLNAVDNAINDSNLEMEQHVVTVKASYGANDKLNAVFRYNVRNLENV